MLVSGVSGKGVKQITGQVARHLGLLKEDEAASDADADWTP